MKKLSILLLFFLAKTAMAHGPSIPPDPWDGDVMHGPSVPPDPWDGLL